MLYRDCTPPEWEVLKEWDYEDVMTRSDQHDGKVVDLFVGTYVRPLEGRSFAAL